MRTVEREQWSRTLDAVRADGYAFLDFLTAIDRGGHLEIVVHVLDPDTLAHQVLGTQVPAHDARLDSITRQFPAAGWHERETAEMFGVTFVHHPDPRPLLLRTTLGAPPLLKSTVLAARAVQPWPGAAEQAGTAGTARPAGRRQPPPGVPVDWLRDGDR